MKLTPGKITTTITYAFTMTLESETRSIDHDTAKSQTRDVVARTLAANLNALAKEGDVFTVDLAMREHWTADMRNA